MVLALCFQACHVARFFFYNFSDVRDYKKFPSKPLTASPAPFHFIEAGGRNNLKFPKLRSDTSLSFEQVLQKNACISFMLIRNDSILYSWQRKGYDESSIVPSFSMAKSFVSVMIGIAIDEGFIKSTEEPITNYIEFFDKNEFGKITIQHLLDMQSGIKFNEGYFNPFGEVAKFYYGNKLKKFMSKLKVEKEPGRDFDYKSVNTQLLSYILEKATGKSPTQYLQEKLWSPLGMEFDASWSVDSKKYQMEKGFCCLNARAKDFAKLGRLYLNKGNWNGKQLVPASYVEQSTVFTKRKNGFTYSNQWWHSINYHSLQDSSRLNGLYEKVPPNRYIKYPYLVSPGGDFFAQGHLGQYVYVSPGKNIIMVRLGKREGKVNWPAFMRDIARKN